MTTRTITVNGQPLKLNIHIESRANATARFGKTGVNIRIPRHVSKAEKLAILQEFEDWAREQVAQNPDLLKKEPGPEYHDGMLLSLGGRVFTLRIVTASRRSGVAHVQKDTFYFEVPDTLSDIEMNQMVDCLISRCVSKVFSPEVSRRVRALNAVHFGRRIRSVRLKNLKSRWGSCSQAGNINLSTRLLCAPPDVMDYVIIHELAHVGMFNHSEKFWKRVRVAMPDYEEKKKWLEENGDSCGFDRAVCGQAPPAQAACRRNAKPAPHPSPQEASDKAPLPQISRQLSLPLDF